MNSRTMSKLARARRVRNGLMGALLAMYSIRLKNFSALEIWRNLVQIKDCWWIILAASETKEERPNERKVDDLLTAAIDRYLRKYRPVLARRDDPPSALWLSSKMMEIL